MLRAADVVACASRAALDRVAPERPDAALVPSDPRDGAGAPSDGEIARRVRALLAGRRMATQDRAPLATTVERSDGYASPGDAEPMRARIP
jgi:hypothetical protein